LREPWHGDRRDGRCAPRRRSPLRDGGRHDRDCLVAERNIDLKTLKASEHARACARLVDAIEQKVLRHVPDDALMGAVCSAQTRPLGDAWAWSRKNSSGNISPLVSATLALSVAMTMEKPRTVAFAWG
jgi:hypothetical protein